MAQITDEHIAYYRIIARWLCRGDPDLADDILQEIYAAVLASSKTEFWRLKLLAKNSAIDYLRSKRHNYSWSNTFQHISLDAMADAGIQIDTKRCVYLPRNFSEPGYAEECMSMLQNGNADATNNRQNVSDVV